MPGGPAERFGGTARPLPGRSAERFEGTARSPRRRTAEPFEATDRWARGRVVAALLAGEPLPPLVPERRARVLAGLERDGLIVRDQDGSIGLPET